jgi:Cu/Ag efflux protein CusF
MREITAAVFVLTLATAFPAAAGTDQASSAQPAGSSQQVITGLVESVDEGTGRIVVDGKTLYMTANGEMAIPEVGQKVTYVYEQRDGQNVITSFRLGQ